MIFCLILFAAVSLLAQENAPLWIQEGGRSLNYPGTEWYTGFAVNSLKGSPDRAKYDAIEKAAQNKLAESIIVQVKGSSTVENTHRQKQNGKNASEATQLDYMQKITSTSNAVLAKMETHSYFDKKNGEIYGFAAVKKKDLANFYSMNINNLFAFADKEFAMAELLAEQGKKKTALDKILAAEDSLKNIGYWGFLLQVVGSNNPYAAKEKDYSQKAARMKSQLENAITVHLDVSGKDCGDLDELLGAQMQEKGCNCAVTKEKENANYLVSVKAKLSGCNESSQGNVFCYASATVTVNNLKSKKSVNVKVPEAKGGWTNGNKDKAAEEAFKILANSLAEHINKAIN
ncbi:MAG: hypothetical protein FWC26_01000 [Fibromonadales bacterium]|nr:hypothetical protein [Fibromonadales bacterium]